MPNPHPIMLASTGPTQGAGARLVEQVDQFVQAALAHILSDHVRAGDGLQEPGDVVSRPGAEHERDDSVEPEVPVFLHQFTHDRDLVPNRSTATLRCPALSSGAEAGRHDGDDVVGVLELCSGQLVPVIASLLVPVVEEDRNSARCEHPRDLFDQFNMIIVLVCIGKKHPDGVRMQREVKIGGK